MQDTLLPHKHTTTWDLVAIVKEIQNLYQPTEGVRHRFCYLELTLI